MQNQVFIYQLFPFLKWLPIVNREVFKADVLAGITAGILILPQAIALAQLAGLPPEFGIYTALFPVIIAALYGSSWHNLSGPNTALCILITIAIAPYATKSSPQWIQYAITLAFMVGIIQLAFSVLRLGIVFNYFSNTVVVSLVTGIGIIIILQQFGNFMGIVMNTGEPLEDMILQIIYGIERANGFTAIVGGITILAGILSKKIWPKLPYLIMAVLVGLVTTGILDFFYGSGNTNIERLGTISLLTFPYSTPDFRPETFSEASEGLFSSAFLIAFLGLMQSSVIAKAMAAKSGQQINVNQEVIGQGLSNIVGSFLSCFPSCGSFNRSASNIEAGARTPLAAIISVIILAMLVLLASPLIAYLPTSIMAGILILVGSALINLDDIKKIMRLRGEARQVFIITLITTLFIGLDTAVILGISLSIIGYLRSASTPEIEILSDANMTQYEPVHKDNTTVLKLTGNLFFGSTHALEQALTDVAKKNNRTQRLVIAAENVQYMDLSGIEILSREAANRKEKGGKLIIWISKDNKIETRLKEELIENIGKENIFHVLN